MAEGEDNERDGSRGEQRDQKHLERRYIERFVRLCCDLPAEAQITMRDEAEPPDTLVALPSNTTVAVEVAELTDEELARGMDGLDRLAAVTERALEDDSLVANVQVDFKGRVDPYVLSRKGRQRIAERILAVVREQAQLGVERIQYDSEQLAQRGIRGVTHVSILLGEGPMVGYGHIEPPGAPPLLRRALNVKEDKLPSYRQAVDVDDYWLLLVAGDKYENSAVSASSAALTTLTSSFGRVYLLDLLDESVVEVGGRGRGKWRRF